MATDIWRVGPTQLTEDGWFVTSWVNVLTGEEMLKSCQRTVSPEIQARMPVIKEEPLGPQSLLSFILFGLKGFL